MTSPLETFNALPADEAAQFLRPACASATWARVLVASRPYASASELAATSDGVLAAMGWSEVEEALADHPRIGERSRGWSRHEQSAATAAAPEVAAALREGNVEYEQRFGHVFLICATGRTAEEMLAALRERLANDDETERRVVRRELSEIVRLRLTRLLT